MITGIIVPLDAAVFALLLAASAAGGRFWPNIRSAVAGQLRSPARPQTACDPLADLFDKDTLAAAISQVGYRPEPAGQRQMMGRLHAIWAEEAAIPSISARTLAYQQSRAITLLPAPAPTPARTSITPSGEGRSNTAA